MKKLCAVEGCTDRVMSRGLCCKHYKRLRKYGDPLAGQTFKGDARRAFGELLAIETDDCVLWPFAKGKGGYGVIGVSPGVVRGTHVVACEMRHGLPPTPAHEVAHSCQTPSCMNYRHLRWATHVENQADMKIHGTLLFGKTSS